MAYEHPVGGSFASQKSGEAYSSADELQREIEIKRAQIGQSVWEIKTTMKNKYETVKDEIHDTFDIRVQAGRYPIAASLGALAVGFVVGRTISRNIGRHDTDLDEFPVHENSRPMTVESHSRSFTSSPTISRIIGRVESAVDEIADRIVSDLTRLGRDVLVPNLIGKVVSIVAPEAKDQFTPQRDQFTDVRRNRAM